MEKQWVLYIVRVCFSLGYPTCNTHAPCGYLWPVRLYNIFKHYLINDTIFRKKKLLNVICVSIFSTTFTWNISHSKKNWARYDQKDRQCTYNVTLRLVLATTVVEKKSIPVTYSECVFVALGIQCEIHIYANLSSVTCPTVQYVSTLSHKWHDLKKNYSTYNVCLSQ